MDSKTTKVLLLDDDSNLRRVLSETLKVKGFKCVPVKTGAAALARIEKQDIDVALIDLKLDDISGLEVLRGIKARSPETECIMLTGHASQAIAIQAVNLGAYSYFQKPFEVDQLLVSIRRAAEKHAAGLALHESEARFRSMIENSTDLFCILNSDATLRYTSPSIARILGYSIEDVDGGTALQDYIHPDDIPAFKKAFRQCIQASDSSPVSLQLRVHHKDGTWRTLEGTGSNLLEHPARIGIIINAREITEPKQVEEALHESEERYRQLVDLTPNGVLIHVDGKIVFANSAGAKILGLAVPGDLVGKRLLDFVHPDYQKIVKGRVKQLTENKKEVPLIEEKLIRLDGSEIDAEVTAIPFVYKNRNAVQVVFYDITARKQAEEALRESEQRLATLISNLPGFVYRCANDRNWTTKFISEGCRDITGYAPEDFLQNKRLAYNDIIRLEYQEPVWLKWQTCLENKIAFEEEYPIITAQGEARWLWERGRGIFSEDGRLLFLEGFITDITERKRAEEALAASEAELRALFASMQDVVMVVDRLGVYIKIAPTNPDLLVKPPEELLGKTLRDVFPSEQAETFLSVLQQVLESKQTTHIEYDLVIGDRTVWFETSISPMTDDTTLWVARDITERKRADDAFKESQRSYQNLVEQIPGVIYRDALDEKASTLFIGPQIKDLTGYAPEEWLSDPDLWVKLLHPDDRARVIAENKHHLATGEQYISDYRLLARDGRIVWVKDEAVTIRDSSGHPLYDQGVLTDITARMQAEEALHESENTLHTIVEGTQALLVSVDVNGHFTYANDATAKAVGYTSPAELIGKAYLHFIHPEDRQQVLNTFINQVNTRQPSGMQEFRIVDTAGKVKWFSFLANLVIKDGQVVGQSGVALDITSRKQAEDALHLSEERYRMLAENMSDTVWLMDMSLRTTYISPSVTRLRGFTLEELNTIPLDQQMPPDSLQRALQTFADTLSPENLAKPDRLISRTVELEFYKKDGTKFLSENTFTLIRDPQGQPIAILGSGRDIGERKKAEAALQNSEKYFRALIENNTDAVVMVDPRGMILYESPTYARIMGRATGQRLGRSGFEYIHAEDRDSVAQMLTELVQHSGEIRQTTFRNQHKDGSWRWIEATGVNLLGESAVHGLVINMHDITGRKHAEEEIRRRVADLEVLYENGLNLSVLLEPGRIAQKMIEILSQKLDWHHAAIRLVNPETRRIELLALNKPGLTPDQTRVEIERLNKIYDSPNKGLSGWVIKHGKTIRSGDVQSDKRYLLTYPEIRSGMYVPLMIGERAIGSIVVESRQANRFSEEDERLLQTLAAQSAISFENARLYQNAVGATKRKAALHQGGLEIVRAGQEIEALCLALHHAVQQVMPADAFTVSLLTKDGREVEVPYLFERGIRHPNTKLPAEAGITGRVLKSKKPLRIKDVQKTRGMKSILVGGAEPRRAILSVPLLAQDKIIGVISTQSRAPDVYTIEDQVFMETLASEAAVAFENARLFEEIRRRLAELESLSQVSDSLMSAIDLQPLLENILAGARNAIPAAEKGTILLTEPDGVLRLQAMSGYTDPRLLGLVLQNQKGYAARVARERIPIKIDDAQVGYEVPYNGKIEEIESVQSGIAAPLIVKGKVIGVISLDNASRKAAFTESELRLLVTFASSAAVAIENARLFTETQQRLRRLSSLHSIDAAIGASVDTNVTLNIVLEHVITELKADAAAVLLFNPLTMMLEYAAGSGFRVHVIEGLRLRLGEGLAGQSVLQRHAIHIADLRQASEVEQLMEPPVSGSASAPLQYLEGENFVAYHAIPLIAKGQVQGVLEIFRRTPMPVDQEWINFFEMLAGQTALAIDNGRLFENLQHSNLELTLAYDATIQGWSQALELRDEETEGHTRRVTELTLRLMQAMGLEGVEKEHARRGSLLHDIGKMAIPDSILLKCGPLDELEWNVMRMHPLYAFNLLSPITYLAPAIPIPYCHHEKWDGSGYPRGLKGEEIPEVARIFAIVDVYDALTSNRPYRLAWTREKAMEYIREQSGMHFDPKVVNAFMDMMAGDK